MSGRPIPPPKTSPISLDDKSKKEDELGTLIVVVLKARNLLDKHSFRKSDVFAQATLNGAQKRTHVDIKGGQRPEWDTEVRFKVMKNAAAKYRKLEVECFSQEPRSEDSMGKGSVDIGETIRTGEFDDWVQLEVDGVARGELYLEMTYYANTSAPAVQQAAAPNKLLSTVLNQNGLSRRPSKLAASDRLSRPNPQAGRPHAQTVSSQQGSRPQPGLSRLSNSSEDRRSPGREEMMPGAFPVQNGSPPSGPVHRPEVTPSLPSSLRPGPGATSSRPQQIRHTSDPHGQQSNLSHNPYISGSPSSNPYISQAGGSLHPPSLSPARAYSPGPSSGNTPAISGSGQQYNTQGIRPVEQRPSGTPMMWQDSGGYGSSPKSNGTFSFPTPVAPHPQTTYNRNNYRDEISGTNYSPRPPPSHDERQGDPYLQTRYQTPLPLPPGANKATSTPSAISQQRPPYTRVPTPPQKVYTPAPDNQHLERLRRVEEAAAQRRAQEIRDMELAMQLDRELNLCNYSTYL